MHAKILLLFVILISSCLGLHKSTSELKIAGTKPPKCPVGYWNKTYQGINVCARKYPGYCHHGEGYNKEADTCFYVPVPEGYGEVY